MISFRGRNPVLYEADRITRKVNSVYPHVSESKSKDYIESEIPFLEFGSELCNKLSDLKIKNSVKIDTLRLKMTSGIELFQNIIYALKEKHFGNCYESARLAEFIGKINGQYNIYPMKLFVTRNRSGADVKLEHVVSVITNEEVNSDQLYRFKNKEAVVLDPWLGITEFASRYIEKIKFDFRHHFFYMPDNEFSLRLLAKQSKNISDFRSKRKEMCFNPKVKFLLHEDDILPKEQALLFKEQYPELVIKDYSKIEL